MTRREKLIERLRSAKAESAFADLRMLLERSGWKLVRQRGSHATFAKPGEPTIVFPLLSGRCVKRPYVMLVLNRLELKE